MRHWIWKVATHGLGMSTAAADSLFGPRWRSDTRFEVIHSGFDFGRFLSVDPRETAKLAIGIPSERFVVGHVGRFAAVKNHAQLVEVVDRLRSRGIDVHLLLVGDGPLMSDVRQAIERRNLLDRVSLVGEQADVVPFYAAMDLFVFPSRFEGLGIVALEAQAAGVPVLASRTLPGEVDVVPGMVHRIELARGADEWASAAVRIANQTAVPLDAAEQVARSRFGIERCLDDLERIYLD